MWEKENDYQMKKEIVVGFDELMMRSFEFSLMKTMKRKSTDFKSQIFSKLNLYRRSSALNPQNVKDKEIL